MNSFAKRIRCLPISFLAFSTGFAALITAPVAMSHNSLPDDALALTRNDIVGPFVAEALRNNPGLLAYDKRYQAARE